MPMVSPPRVASKFQFGTAKGEVKSSPEGWITRVPAPEKPLVATLGVLFSIMRRPSEMMVAPV